MGVKSLKMTLRYADFALEQKIKAVNMLDKVLSKQPVKNMQLDNYFTISRKTEFPAPSTTPKSLIYNGRYWTNEVVETCRGSSHSPPQVAYNP